MSGTRVQRPGLIRGPLKNVRDNRHGTTAGYYYYGCRCDKCRTAASESARARRKARSENLHLETHGLPSTYVNANCRCDLCVEAYREYNHARKAEVDKRKAELKITPSPAVVLSDLA